ncbi:transcriptional regulator [Thermococcus stetteri]|uniref:transcriptional regulator n=1 Tax=Thermococcus stetteri TaxID=49900 RepID=UPI001AE45C17|nr:transcriptional regulator [Thermococcus stetteri]MBP1912920.1 putative transcriptional regulator [Thermococcus stetteri]
MERGRLIKTVEAVLRASGYRVARLDLKGSCFDLVASGLFLLLFIKVAVNIDAVSEEQVEDLKRLAKFFKASPLIVGLRSKSGELEEGVVYERFGVYALRPETLYDALLNNELPAVFAERGGLYVRINGELLRELREKHGYSVNDLAQLLGVSRKSLLNYERGEQAVSLEVAIRLEELFDEALAEPIDVLNSRVEAKLDVKPESPLEREVFERLRRLGFGLVKVKKAPFNAVSKGDDFRILTGIDERKTRSTVRRAEMVAEVSRIINSDGVFILEKTKTEVVKEVPIIPKESLREVKDADELIKMIEELKREIKAKLFS